MLAGYHMITLPVRGDGKGDNVLAHAAAIAHQFGGHVQVLHCRATADDMMPFGVVVPGFLRAQLEEAAATNAKTVEDALHAEFRGLAGDMGLTEQGPERGKATATFIEYSGKQTNAVREYGRLSDLICVPQPDPNAKLGANTLASALFSTGRPVMMCPPCETPPKRIGAHVAICWNGSLEAARAVTLGLPMIRTAQKVTILTGGNTPTAASAADLQTYLGLRGIQSEIRAFEASGGNVGDRLLAEAGAVGADLMVMGAYHDSYEREVLLGGNTQTVSVSAQIPVLMVH